MKLTGWINLVSVAIIVFSFLMMLSDNLDVVKLGLLVFLGIIIVNTLLVIIIDDSVQRIKERYLRIKKILENL